MTTGQAVPSAPCPPPAQRCPACPRGTTLDGGFSLQAGGGMPPPPVQGPPGFGLPGFGFGVHANVPMPQVQWQAPQMQWQGPPPMPLPMPAPYPMPPPQWQPPPPPPMAAPMPAPMPGPGYNPNVNPYSAGMAALQQQTMHWGVKLALGGGWGVIVLLLLYWGNEWYSGRWSPWKTKESVPVVVTEPTTGTPGAVSVPGGQVPPANQPAPPPPVGFQIGDGNYMYRLDHERRLIQLGRLPPDNNARIQIMNWKAEGYNEVAWVGGESDVLHNRVVPVGQPRVVHAVPAELVDTLRQLADKTDQHRRELAIQYPHRFSESEGSLVNSSTNEMKSLADRALGIAQGAGQK